MLGNRYMPLVGAVQGACSTVQAVAAAAAGAVPADAVLMILMY